MKALSRFCAVAFGLLITLAALAPVANAQQNAWENVARIVVIGDLEGDYDKFVDMLRTARVIDSANAWIGGETHLVQLGDIPDRGPHSRAIIDLLRRLEPAARRSGGRVHALIGNHEAMNVEGDLRYVHPGEYAAFADRRSERRRSAFYRQTLDFMRANPPTSGLPVFDEAFRTEWESNHPLGYVEHRQAWATSGTYGAWVAGNNSVIRINDSLFLHGGLGPTYVNAERDEMNEAVRAALLGRPRASHPDILTDEDGPLWYRGLSVNSERTEEAHLAALLAHHGVARVVVGHSKIAPTVFPRFDGRVIVTDIAVRRGQTDPHAFLVIEGETLTTIHRGQSVPLTASTSAERCAYLNAVAALDPPDSPLAALAAEMCALAPAATD